jgi:hypothetical protein
LDAGEFIGGVIDDFVGLNLGCGIRAEALDFAREDDESKNEKCLEHQRRQHAAVGEDSEGSFSGETRGRTGEGWTDGGGEVLPAGRPFDEQLGSAGKLANGARLEFESWIQEEVRNVSY